MVSALDYGLKGLGSSLGPGHCVLLGCIHLTFNWKFSERNEDKQESNSNDPQTTFDLPCAERLSCQLQQVAKTLRKVELWVRKYAQQRCAKHYYGMTLSFT